MNSLNLSFGTYIDRTIITDDNIINEIVSNNFTIATFNAQSLKKNFKHLDILTQSNEYDIITISETWNPSVPCVKIKGYHDLILKPRPKKRGGGVGIYLKSNLSYSLNSELNNVKFKIIETVACNVQIQQKNITVISIYRPPNTDTSDSLEDFKTIFELCQNTDIILAGDMNINLDTKNNLTDGYINLLQEHQLRQSVMTSTRLTKDSKTRIDHVISNRIINSMVTHHMIGDHQLIISTIGSLK